jgi:hypothetical protein
MSQHFRNRIKINPCLIAKDWKLRAVISPHPPLLLGKALCLNYIIEKNIHALNQAINLYEEPLRSARQNLRNLIEKDIPDAHFRLGLIYEIESRVPYQPSEIRKWHQSPAAQGHEGAPL